MDISTWSCLESDKKFTQFLKDIEGKKKPSISLAENYLKAKNDHWASNYLRRR